MAKTAASGQVFWWHMQAIQIYLAGTCIFGIAPGMLQYRKLPDYQKRIVERVAHRLESYHYIGPRERVQREMREAGVKLFLDSGAFSAYTLGGELLDLQGYVDFVKQNMDLIRVEDGIPMIAVLDGIGDALLTYQNQAAMESLGVRPLPCFHAGEDERYLAHYVKNYEYITLGGMVGGSITQLQAWLDRVWERYLLDGSGNPRIKVHGFGVTTESLMWRYPWYSVDSSTWIQTTSFGGISLPDYGVLDLSLESPSRHMPRKHFDNITEIERDHVVKILTNYGFTVPELQSQYLDRAAWNILYYELTEKSMSAVKLNGHRVPLPRELF